MFLSLKLRLKPKIESDHFGDSTKQWGLAFYTQRCDRPGQEGDSLIQNTVFGHFLTCVTPFVSEQWKYYTWVMRNEAFPHLFPDKH